VTTAVTTREIPIASAQAACDRWHSHHEPPVGGLFALGAFDGPRLVCVAVVSRPVARRLDTGSVAEVTRLASDGSVRGAASALLRACVREAAARGYRRVVSYTLLGESGACYRAARWRTAHVTRAGQWARASRSRKPAAQPGRKIRWEAGAEALPRSMRAWRELLEQVGRVALATRTPAQMEMAV
jgi:hypothetical protein